MDSEFVQTRSSIPAVGACSLTSLGQVPHLSGGNCAMKDTCKQWMVWHLYLGWPQRSTELPNKLCFLPLLELSFFLEPCFRESEDTSPSWGCWVQGKAFDGVVTVQMEERSPQAESTFSQETWNGTSRNSSSSTEPCSVTSSESRLLAVGVGGRAKVFPRARYQYT